MSCLQTDSCNHESQIWACMEQHRPRRPPLNAPHPSTGIISSRPTIQHVLCNNVPACNICHKGPGLNQWLNSHIKMCWLAGSHLCLCLMLQLVCSFYRVGPVCADKVKHSPAHCTQNYQLCRHILSYSFIHSSLSKQKSVVSIDLPLFIPIV